MYARAEIMKLRIRTGIGFGGKYRGREIWGIFVGDEYFSHWH